MPIDFDALVLGPAMDAFAGTAILTPVASQPGEPAYSVRGVFAIKGNDYLTEETGAVRADDTTFGVRASEFEIMALPGDLVSEIVHPTFQRFLAGRVFVIDDTGDDGQGGQTWVLKDQRDADDEP